MPTEVEKQIQSQTADAAHKIRMEAGGFFAGKPDGFNHLKACTYFTDSLEKEVSWAIKENNWTGLRVYLPSTDLTAFEIIYQFLIDYQQPPKILARQNLGPNIASFTYYPTVIPTLWMREIVTQTEGQIHASRTVYAQAALLDLQ